MFASLTKLFGGNKSTPATRANTTAFRPAAEELGDRIVPAGAYVSGTTLNIVGTEGGDWVNVDLVRTANGQRGVKVSMSNINYQETFTQANISLISFSGYGGDDWFDNKTAIRTCAFGDGGGDVLRGGSGNDYLFGGAGNDWIVGRAGDDWLYGEGGYDNIYGGDYLTYIPYDGFDHLSGGYDGINDYLNGGSGTDEYIRYWKYNSWWFNYYENENAVMTGEDYYTPVQVW